MKKVRNVLALVIVLGLTASACSAQVTGTTRGKSGDPAATSEKRKECCGAMMAERRAMREEMAAMDRKLDSLVEKMKATQGTEKIEVVAAVVEELVSQRKRMHGQMAEMCPAMMRHEGMTEGTSECPMMEKGKSIGEKGKKEGHETHHPGDE